METFRIEVGSVHGIKPGNVVGAIANESGLEGVHIGRVDIRDDHSYVDLPEGMPKQIFKELQKVRVAGRELRISRVSEKPPKPPRATIGRHSGAAPREAGPGGKGPEVRRVKPKITARRRAKD
jgi:ATP-dependent RNA helicase DeaD